MGRGRRCVRACFVAVSLLPWRAAAQQLPGASASETLNLFFDCQGSGCYDTDFYRREIPFVNWVRDREVSDVHVLVTSQTTGGGGRQYVLRFLGRGPFQGQDQELLVNTAGDATTDETRNALVSRLRLGLGRYLAGTPLADRLRVVSEGPPAGGTPGSGGPGGTAAPEDDPWDFWVFTIRGNSFLNGESSYESANYSGSLSANRTTDAWKLDFSGRFSRNTQVFDLDDTTSVETEREEWNANALVVKSITDRFSVGATVGVGRSTYVNENFRWNVSPGVEFNLFPYAESSRRSLTFQGLLNVRHWDYETETIFGQTSETRLAFSLDSELEFVQPWGRASIGAGHSRYLHDTDKWQSTINGSVEWRIFKGFSLTVSGYYEWVRDQLYLEAEGYTQEEILTRQRALATSFEYFTMFGISYRFGSIFNNVVNPRFGSGGGGGFTIMY